LNKSTLGEKLIVEVESFSISTLANAVRNGEKRSEKKKREKKRALKESTIG